MAFPLRPTRDRTASAARTPAGFYAAVITRHDSGTSGVFVRVPRLTGDFEWGPVPTTGSRPAVNSQVWVTFIEGRANDLIVVSGGGAATTTPTTAGTDGGEF